MLGCSIRNTARGTPTKRPPNNSRKRSVSDVSPNKLLSKRWGIFRVLPKIRQPSPKGMPRMTPGVVIGCVMKASRLRYPGMKQFQKCKPLVQTTRLSIGGMTCGGCVDQVTKALNRLTGVTNVDVDLRMNDATVEHLPDSVDPRDVVAAVQGAGYQARVSDWGAEAADAGARSTARGCYTSCCCEH
jgi:copper chaperone CopZ